MFINFSFFFAFCKRAEVDLSDIEAKFLIILFTSICFSYLFRLKQERTPVFAI